MLPQSGRKLVGPVSVPTKPVLGDWVTGAPSFGAAKPHAQPFAKGGPKPTTKLARLVEAKKLLELGEPSQAIMDMLEKQIEVERASKPLSLRVKAMEDKKGKKQRHLDQAKEKQAGLEENIAALQVELDEAKLEVGKAEAGLQEAIEEARLLTESKEDEARGPPSVPMLGLPKSFLERAGGEDAPEVQALQQAILATQKLIDDFASKHPVVEAVRADHAPAVAPADSLSMDLDFEEEGLSNRTRNLVEGSPLSEEDKRKFVAYLEAVPQAKKAKHQG